MSPATFPSPTRPTRIPAWVILAVGLSLEYLAFSYLFDARDLLAPAGLADIRGLGNVAALGFVIAATTVITGGTAAKTALHALGPWRRSRSATWISGALHALLAGATFFATHRVIHATDVSSARSFLAIGLLCSIASALTAIVAAFEPARFLGALRPLGRSLSLGCGVGFVSWGAGLLAALLWEPLARLTLEFVHALLTVLTPDPVASVAENLVGTSRFFVHVAPECSGLEGIGLMVSFMAAFLYVERKGLRWPEAFVLLPASAVLIWLLNVVRITALVGVGTWLSPAIALGGFHSKAGWVLFTVAALGTVLLVRESSLLRQHADRVVAGSSPALATEPAPGRGSVADSAEAAFLLPLLAILAVSLVSGLATAKFDHFYPLRVLTAVAVLARYRREYPSFRPAHPWSSCLIGLALGGVWLLGVRGADSSTAENLGEALEALPRLWAGVWLAFRVVGTALVVPVVEELAFRGFLLRRMTTASFESLPLRRASWAGLAVSSVAFGVLHSEWLLGILAGVVFGLVAKLRGSLGDAIAAHAAANLFLAGCAVTTGQWALLG